MLADCRDMHLKSQRRGACCNLDKLGDLVHAAEEVRPL